MTPIKAAALLAVTAILAPGAASAAIFAPVPASLYITFGGNDWAWANPCGPGGCNYPSQGIDLSYQSTQGWRIATAADLLTGPTAADFGTPDNFKCATPYFSFSLGNCDYAEGAGRQIWNAPTNVVGEFAETWVIRDGAAPSDVPEPASWAMMLSGFGLVGTMLRNRRGALVTFA